MEKISSTTKLNEFVSVINNITDEVNNLNSIHFIDVNTHLDTLLTPGIYICRNGLFEGVPGFFTQLPTQNGYHYDDLGQPLSGWLMVVQPSEQEINQYLYVNSIPGVVIRVISNGSIGRWWISSHVYSSNKGIDGRPTLGLVSPDNKTIKTTNYGVLSVIKEGLMASSSVIGLMKPDNDTLSVSNGIIKIKKSFAPLPNNTSGTIGNFYSIYSNTNSFTVGKYGSHMVFVQGYSSDKSVIAIFADIRAGGEVLSLPLPETGQYISKISGFGIRIS